MSEPTERQLAPSDGVYTNKDGNRFKVAKGDPIPEGMTFEPTSEKTATGATGATGPGQFNAATTGTRQTTASKAQQPPKAD